MKILTAQYNKGKFEKLAGPDRIIRRLTTVGKKKKIQTDRREREKFLIKYLPFDE